MVKNKPLMGVQQVLLSPDKDTKAILEYLCQQSGKLYNSLTEESYTSKSSFLDGDSLPKYGVSEAGRSPKPEGGKASGRRILRGLYLTGEKFLVNADLNGSANILKKVTGKLKLNLSKLTRRCLTTVTRIRLN